MGVVINEFEVVAEPPAAPGRRDETVEATKPEKPLEPCAVAAAMRTLETQALRVWAH